MNYAVCFRMMMGIFLVVVVAMVLQPRLSNQSNSIGRLPRSRDLDLGFAPRAETRSLYCRTECQDGQLALYIGRMQQ